MTSDDLVDLPADVIVNLLEAATDLSGQVGGIMVPAFENRDALRNELLEREWIWQIPEIDETKSVVAVDGAHRQENLFAGDLLSALAVCAEGMDATGIKRTEPLVSSAHWSRFVNHDADLDRTVKCAMHAMETQILAQIASRFDLVIMDGSFQTPVIAFNSALAAHGTLARQMSLDVLDEFDTPTALTQLCSPSHATNVVACPKSDSSVFLTDLFEEQFGITLPCTDKVLASIVLEPGEMIQPMKPTSQWQVLHIQSAGTSDPVAVAMAGQLDGAIDPLRRIEQGESVGITYFKPDGSATAIKMEFKAINGKQWGAQACAHLAAQCTPPHLQEPYPQFLVDGWAKAIAPATNAQLESMRLDLAETHPDALEYVIRSYRT